MADRDTIKGTIDTAADRAKTGIDSAADKAKNLTDRAGGNGGPGGGVIDSAKQAVQGVVDRVGDFAGQARDKAGEAGQKVQQWAGDAYDVAADNLGDLGQELTSLIRRHPIPALLVGFGVGLLLGRSAKMI
jgi:hypothetical protein